ncbi:hypothetical protein E2C01_000921 [Portunus trituberculatus]|uniref:Uncharacterized protein n=1 Tax=Portunus trituberculatus TaxID=210409 RepID=A0A5B7CFX5_PORTR|nr:hypothetical protein [Portunus trituberculatus]
MMPSPPPVSHMINNFPSNWAPRLPRISKLKRASTLHAVAVPNVMPPPSPVTVASSCVASQHQSAMNYLV